MKKTKIGIIGADSFHCVALVEQYLKMENVEICFVDITLRGNLDTSLKRQERFIEMLKDKVRLEKINLNEHDTVDIYIILNMDSNSHFDTINRLSVYNKPIFVDKPIFTDLSLFDEVKAKVMSSSGLRFVDILRNIEITDDIFIEAPLYYVDGVDGWFWYGIHMLDMLEELTDSSITIENVTTQADGEIVEGKCGKYKFKLHGIYDDVNFKLKIGNESRELSSYNHLYYSLAQSILQVDSWPSLTRTKRVISAIIEINKKKSKH